MRIVLDAMGSDAAPLHEVEGAVEASLTENIEILLTGDESKLKPLLDMYPKRGKITIVHASEVITMEDSAGIAVRKKKDASMLVGLRLVKSGEAAGLVSAGNTGAFHLAARIVLGRIKGVARSAMCTLLPTMAGRPVLLLDVGAGVDSTARHLCEFAEMGLVYSQLALDVESPRVGLLNIGEEVHKGNEMAKTVHRNLCAAKQVNFIGNVEPKAMFEGKADVVVCDGFVGNVILKTSEAVAALITKGIKRELESTLVSKLGAALSVGAFKRLKRTSDPNLYPGAPMLGINGVVVKIHGSSSPVGVASGIRGVARAARGGLTEHIRTGIENLRTTEADLRKQEGTR